MGLCTEVESVGIYIGLDDCKLDRLHLEVAS